MQRLKKLSMRMSAEGLMLLYLANSQCDFHGAMLLLSASQGVVAE